MSDQANVAFCDDHVETPTLKFLFADTSDAALSAWNRDHQPHRERLRAGVLPTNQFSFFAFLCIRLFPPSHAKFGIANRQAKN
jgi:hypothetical protein